MGTLYRFLDKHINKNFHEQESPPLGSLKRHTVRGVTCPRGGGTPVLAWGGGGYPIPGEPSRQDWGIASPPHTHTHRTCDRTRVTSLEWTWDQRLGRDLVPDAGSPPGKNMGPDAGKGPGTRGWGTPSPPVNRQTPVKTNLPSYYVLGW